MQLPLLFLYYYYLHSSLLQFHNYACLSPLQQIEDDGTYKLHTRNVYKGIRVKRFSSVPLSHHIKISYAVIVMQYNLAARKCENLINAKF